MNNKIKTIFFLFVLLISSFSVIAQPPFDISQESIFNTPQIIYPKIFYIQQNSDFYLYVHFSNSTGNVLPVTDYDCVLHFYDSQGIHLIEENMADDSNGFDKEYIINTTITSNLGYYYYNIWCNSTQGESAFVSEELEVTASGFESSDNYLPIVLAIGLFAFLMLYGSFQIQNRDLDIIKSLLFLLGFLFAVVLLLLPVMIALNPYNLGGLLSLFEGFFGVGVLILVGFLYFYGIYLVTRVFKRQV